MKKLNVKNYLKNCVIGYFTGTGIALLTLFGLGVFKGAVDELRNLEKTKE